MRESMKTTTKMAYSDSRGRPQVHLQNGVNKVILKIVFFHEWIAGLFFGTALHQLEKQRKVKKEQHYAILHAK